MATTLGIAFPWGRYHATPWGRNVNEAVVEWPPSPWRLLRALYATWRTRAPHLDDEVVHRLLHALADPPEFELPPHTEAHTRHYLPDMTHMRGMPTWQATTAYSDDAKDKAIDAFAVIERGGQMLVRWPQPLDGEPRAALAELAGLLPHLGRAESICEARLADDDETVHDGARCPPEPLEEHGGRRPVRVLVPRQPLDLAALTIRTLDLRSQRRLQPPGARWVEYMVPYPAQPVARSRHRRPAPVTAVRWSIATPARPSRKAALAMTHVLRQACMAQLGRSSNGSASPVLAGKDAAGAPLEGHRHAHYLAFAANQQRAGGRLDTLVVWAPAGFGDKELAAFARLHQLRPREFISDFRPCRLGLESCGDIEDVAPELCGPARTWTSRTPFAPTRHPRRRRQPWDEHLREQVTLELTRRGLAEPADVDVLGGDWLAYRRHRPSERLENARRAKGMTIRFTAPVKGPLSLGALSHFGLGLFLPAE